jgi:hypothetical protein
MVAGWALAAFLVMGVLIVCTGPARHARPSRSPRRPGSAPARHAVPRATDPGGGGRPGLIHATNPDATGPHRNLPREDERAFWAWACVEVFRHTGVRIEELLEITHRSFVSYTLPTTGEVIPMLQITSSKTDKKRLWSSAQNWPASSPRSSTGSATAANGFH